jgi:hypothetical protein
MNPFIVGGRKGKTRHCVDLDVYTKLSKAKSLCGIDGNKLIHYNAIFFNYEMVYPVMCKTCLNLSKK